MTTNTKEEVKAFIEQIESDLSNGREAQIFELKLARIALASLDAEPVGYFYADKPGDWYQLSDGDRVPSHRRIPLYANPQSSPVVKLPHEFISSEGIVVQIEKLMAALAVHGIQYERKGNACRAAMLQGGEPVSQTYKLPELIEGMEVSIDVSTCDADAGNRYFGTVTEVSELDSAKNGYILLVQNAEPNFDVNGNSPVIPDGWISCSERMPDKGQRVLVCVDFDSSTVTPLVKDAEYTGSTFRIGHNTINTTGETSVTHWMPLPAPPQQ
ncbi:DUF551 domain-containing protein [Salmonella enterica subsp. enterica serovar Albany]|nr:DUF551 domain-containing protein [Salmonella enterica subsp. enterica serovar Duesseldorf]EBS5868456.1 DUF551 domain-containing protein [Salmonella enterica subsp. enterica serovar Albany]ECA9266550.1 DUF551 domain-containing protein [Salmonella enterica subsp. enterica serovar Newport]ECF2343380.1 DUF551 domain-containing protein [Salmonella enterica subsp. enterica serovar Corvallis]EDR0220575.1 DUF551 domain-containing protein [Salmonella enterica subsp. enterica]